MFTFLIWFVRGFKSEFSTLKTWLLLRENHAHCSWAQGTWFSMATPKFAFITWLAMWDRLATMDRVAKWSLGVDTTCVLCKSAAETRNHLFFECSFSLQLWKHLTLGILGNSHSNTWSVIVPVLSGRSMEKKRIFCVRQRQTHMH